ncbi:MAG: hypothetical protein CMJ18_02245 [Phycisphaeraceae bacterium]|nr:hypothetical protein [Phycisphaeraceae bacterium]
MRLSLTAIVMACALALVTQAQAQTVFTDNFESHSAGNSIIGTNGWYEQGRQGNASDPLVIASVPGLSGQAGDGNAVTGDPGSSFVAIANDAGLAGGADPVQDNVLSWKWLVNRDMPTGSTGFGLLGTRTSMAIVRNQSTSQEGWELNVSDTLDTDNRYALPQGGGVEQVLDLRIVFNSSDTQFFMNGQLLQTSPSNGGSGQFANINGIRWGINNDPNIGAGFIDDIVVQLPEPTSLGLLALGGLMMWRRR